MHSVCGEQVADSRAPAERLCYSGARLERADERRKDPAWLAARLAQPDSRLVPVWRDRNLVAELGVDAAATVAVTYPRKSTDHILAAAEEIAFLGIDGETAVFAADLSTSDEAHLAPFARDAAFIDLRQAGSLMEPGDAALLAYARGLLTWHRTHRYCGLCGQATKSRNGGHTRVCGACDHQVFPRIDPAVIMLVQASSAEDGRPICLLGRHRRLPPGIYSTLAGFVEPGESLEETVAREVWEEAGVRVGEVVYQASQPWPFPASIMLGFRARAESLALTIDRTELEEARWFTAEQVSRFGEWGDEDAEFRLPRRDSIARFLVESWLRDVAGGGARRP